MKKTFLATSIMLCIFGFVNNAGALCLQCPEIQKELKKEIKLTSEQNKEIKSIKQEMKKQLKSNEKEYNANQKKIDKILSADNPDIVSMMDVKNQNSKIKLDMQKIKQESYSRLFEVYTDDQKETAKRILSENSGIATKKPCEFCETTCKKEKCNIKNRQKTEY